MVSPATSSLAREPEGPRRFTDAAGRHWTVTEELIPPAEWTLADKDGHAAGYAVGWLHFSCAGLRKRLRFFPSHWRTFSDAALDQLCRRALELHSAE